MIDKRRMVAGMLTAALFTTALPGLAFAQDEAEADAVFAAEGLEWLLQGYAADDIWNEVPVPVEVSLLLQDGTASGNAGCNDYTGSYEITEDTLIFGEEFAVTMMFCEGPGGEIEQSYLATLPTVAGWSVDGYTLQLSDVEGTDVLQYEEAVVELRGSDLAQLNGTLTDLTDAVISLDGAVSLIDARLIAVEENIGQVNIKGVRDRVKVLEDQMTQVQKDMAKVQDQQKNMGNRLGGQDTRIAATEADIDALEEQVGVHFEAYPVPEPY